MSLTALRQDPRFRELGIEDQLKLGQNFLARELSADPRFQSLSSIRQQRLIEQLALASPTFNDEALGDRIRSTGLGYARGASGAGLDKAGYELVNSAISSSGIASLVSLVFGGEGGAARRSDRQRALQYFKAVESISGRSDPWGEIGSILGFVGDIAAVNVAFRPLVSAATVGIQAKAAGTSVAAYKAATSAGRTVSTLYPKLSMYAPIAAESAIEAVPYFVLTEAQRKASGQPTALSMGAGEVAKTLGLNAAADFVVGSALTAVLGYTGRILQGTFRKSDLYDLAYKNAEEEARLINQIETGTMDPKIYAGLHPITQDRLQQGIRINRFLREGAADPEAYLEDRAALLGLDIGQIWNKMDDGTYRLWKYDKSKTPRSFQFQNFNDLENELTSAYYKKWQKAIDLDTKAAVAGVPDYKPQAVIRPENQWAVIRGRTLNEAHVKLSPTDIAELDPDLAGVYKAAGVKPRDPSTRPVVTRAEADSISKLADPDATVVQAQLPLSGRITENINDRQFNLLRGQSSLTVAPSDAPNALIVGTKNAPPEVYQAGVAKAAQVAADNGIDPEAALSSLMLNAGFDHVRLPDGSVKFFSTRALRLIGSPDDVVQAMRKPVASGAASSGVVVNEVFTKHVDATKFAENSDVVMSGAVKALRSGSPDDYRDFSKAYLRGSNIDVPVNVLQTNASKVVVRTTADGVNVYVPAKISNFTDEAAAMEDLLSGLDAVALAKAVPGVELPPTTLYAERFRKDPLKFGFPADVDPTSWINAAADSIGARVIRNADGSWVMDLAGTPLAFRSTDDLVDALARRTMDSQYVRDDLLAQGARIQELPDGSVQIRSFKSGKILASGPNLGAALDKFGWAPSTVSNRFAPTGVSFGGSGFDMQWYGEHKFSSWAKATKFLSKFEDQADSAGKTLFKTNANGRILETPSRQFEVFSPKYNVWQRFDNPGDAVQFLNTQVKSLDDLGKIADKKMLDFTVEQNQFVLRAPDGTVHRLDTQDALVNAMKEYPDIEKSVRSILDFTDPTIESSVSDLVAQWRKSQPLAGMNKLGRAPEFETPDRKLLPTYTAALASTEQTTALVELLTTKSNDPQLLRMFRGMEASRKAAEVDNNRAVRYLDTLFRDDSGKLVSRESRQKIWYWLGQDTGTAAAELPEQFAKRYGKALEPLNATEQRIATGLREYYRTLGRKFGIQFDKLIFEYMPRLRALNAPENAGMLNNLGTADELVRKVPGWETNPPKEIKFWAEHERVDEALSYIYKDDALEVAMLYTAQGHKKFYLNPQWKDMYNYMNQSRPEELVVQTMNRYREQIMGMTRSPGEKTLEIFGAKLFTALKRSPIGKLIPASELEMEEMGRGILSSFMGLTYVSSMGWKPFLAIRNTFQTWTMAGPRLGVDWVQRGWKSLENNMEAEVKRLRALGVVSEKLPIINQVFSHSTKLGRIAEQSMQWFKNSDDLTRAWTYKSAELKFNNAVQALLDNKIGSPDAFAKLSGLSRMDKVMAADIWKRVATRQADQLALATHEFASKITKDAMFEYSASETPAMFKGVVGKLFGQFGTYSAGFRANMARMFVHGSAAERAEMVATYLAVTGALWATFEAFKIKTNDFVPFAPAIFTGGPMFDIAIDTMKSADPGYEGNLARARLKQSMPLLAPGSAQFRYATKAQEYLSQGDLYRGFLSLTATPVVPD